MRSRRPSPEHEQAVARRLALLAAEWDTAKAAGGEPRNGSEGGSSSAAVAGGDEGVVPAGGPWIWNPPTRVAGAAAESPAPAPVPVEQAEQIEQAEQVEPVEQAEHAEDALLLVEQLPPLVRAPGRHAARRAAVGGWNRAAQAMSGWVVPPVVAGRVRLHGTHLTWVAVLVALALGATCWWLVESKESTVLTPVSASFSGKEADRPEGQEPEPQGDDDESVQGALAGPSASAPGPVAREDVAEVVVDVAGKVRRPGIVVLPAGSRVVDAIKEAGGAKRGVDLTSLNLARLLVDGEQILVGTSAASGAGAAPGPATSPAGALVNLNNAGQVELETLPGVGPVTAAAIIEWRGRHGGFTSVEDLLEVNGIGEATLKRLAPLVSV